MKTLSAFSLAALILITVSAPSLAGETKKNTAQTQAATTNQQLSVKILRLRFRAYQISQ